MIAVFRSLRREGFGSLSRLYQDRANPRLITVDMDDHRGGGDGQDGRSVVEVAEERIAEGH